MTNLQGSDFLRKLASQLNQDGSTRDFSYSVGRIADMVNSEASLDDAQQAAIRRALMEFNRRMTSVEELTMAAAINTFRGASWRLGY